MRRAAWLCALALVACDAQRTEITLDVPPSARGRIVEVWVGAFDPDQTVCTELAFWATGSCGQACADAPAPLDRGAATHAVSLAPDEDGRFGAPELDVSGATRWDVVVIAEVEGDEPLYGCRAVSAGEAARVPLFWPWCSARACDRLFHPACGAEVECAAEPLLDPLAVSCRVAQSEVAAWEEDGAACDPPPSSAGPCRLAQIRCEEGLVAPVTDGVCPRPSAAEMCVASEETYMQARDVDCDGAHPLCEMRECDAGSDERLPCGDGTCVGVTVCLDGTFGECIFGDVEACNGDDDDCDDDVDEGDGPLADCNMGRRPDAPSADACRAGGCACGGGAACRGFEACCEGACVEIAASVDHCGACGNACGAGQRCVRGSCARRDDAGAAARDAGPDRECDDVATCNLTHDAADTCGRDGRCACGAGAPCALPEICCGGSCVDPRADTDHCGGCDNPCRVCLAGSCR